MSSSHKGITCGRGRSTAQNSPRSIQQTFYESYQEGRAGDPAPSVLTLPPSLQYHPLAGPVTVLDTMHSVITRSLACFLILSILLVGGLASAQSISHESHHNTHHQKATHSTSLCTWMCAAGNVLDPGTVPYLIDLSPVAWSEPHSTISILPSPLHQTTSRGPPSLSVS